MTDNVTAQSGIATSLPDATVIATDNIAGINYQRVKQAWGADGTANDVSTSAPLPVQGTIAISSASVSPSTQWTVSVTPTTQFSVTTTPSSQITASVAPTTQWTITTTPSSQVTNSVSPTTQWTVSVTPTTQFTVANSSSTGVIGSVMPSTQWTVSVTPTTQWTISVTPTTQFTNSVTPTTQWTVTTTPSSVETVTLSSGILALGTVAPTVKTTTSLSNITVSTSSTAVGGANLLVAGVAANTVRAFRGSLTASAAVTIGIYDSSSTAATTLANIPLVANGSFNFDTFNSGEPLFVTASSGALAINLNAAAQIRGFIQYTQS